MLFNTLAYAKFFAIVFVISWLLVHRRLSLLLPWFGLFGYVLTHCPTGPGLLVSLVTLLGTLGVLAKGRGVHTVSAPPSLVDAILGVTINALGLAWLSTQDSAPDPLSQVLQALLVPEPNMAVARGFGAALVVAVAVAVVRARRVRLLFLLGASYLFYANWDWRFLPLIFASSSIDWWLGRAIGAAKSPRAARRLLVLTLILNLGILAVFKYLSFGIQTGAALLAWLAQWPSLSWLIDGVHGLVAPVALFFGLDLDQLAVLQVALPIGISFFTFESMSYVIDVYRGHLRPHQSYSEYLAFVAFFPHLVAGPIVRPRDLLPQLSLPARFNPAEASEGLFLVALGLVKKVAVADYLALNLVDRVFDAPAQYSSVECYAAVVGYAVQIYCDFSGYTDVAIGSALLLGVRFPKNFDAPYKARSIQDFWRRWHISLSTWLRDYLYIPLGGGRKGVSRTYANLMITMLLGGLWHGAQWTFVLWGGLHGLALVVNRSLSGKTFLPALGPRAAVLVNAGKILLTFHFVCATWIFFRAPTFDVALAMFRQLAEGSLHRSNLPPSLLACLALGLLGHFVPEYWFQRALVGFVRAPAVAQAFVLLFACWTLREMGSASAVPFVYFQF